MLAYGLTLVTRYGRRIAVSFNAGVFADADGKALGILTAAHDITAQKELEQQLRNSQFYTRSLIESNIDALMTTDPLGIITDVNQQMESLTGHTREELIGTPFKHYFTDPERAEEGVRLVLQEGRVTDYELTARRKDGADTVVSYNATTFYDRDGRLQGVFAAARDVTERKRFEEALQEKNLELENANLAKDRFLASMSHELRTPLNAIIGFTGTMLMELPGPLNDEQRKQLVTVQQSAKHLLSIINDLLDLAKIESGKVELNLEQVDCASVIEEVAGSLRPLAEQKGLVLDVRLPENTVTSLTDRWALSQILINLTNNAIKFTERGTVTVRLDRARDDGTTRTSIRVVDTGPGISPEEQERLFSAFQRSRRSRDSATEGTWVCTSARLAELLGASIAVESEVGRGSTFSVLLPR
ncbi:MAG: PAS domain-containing sensor histidine kinase [Actinomycetota bacterium]